MVSALITVGEILKKERDIAHLQIAAAAKFVGNVFGYVLRPPFCVLKATTRIGSRYLAGQKILDDPGERIAIRRNKDDGAVLAVALLIVQKF